MLIPLRSLHNTFSEKCLGKVLVARLQLPAASDSFLSKAAAPCGSLPPAGLLTKKISTKTLEFISLPLKLTAAEQTNPLSWPFFLSMGSWLQRHFGKGLCGDSHCSLNTS